MWNKGGFPLSRKILRAFYVRKKHARKQFPLLRKIILLRCLFLTTFTYVFALQTLWALGWKQKEREFDLSGKKKMAAAVNKRLLPLFYLRQRRKKKQRYRKKVLDKGYISKPFSTWRIPHASERNARKWPRVIFLFCPVFIIGVWGVPKDRIFPHFFY